MLNAHRKNLSEPKMRVPLSMLRAMVDVTVDIKELAVIMNGRMAEVEHIFPPLDKDLFGDVVIARMRELLDQDENWELWSVETSHGECEIVVGKKYGVQTDWLYGAILAGGRSPDGTEVTNTTVGQFESMGMLVSEDMLGVGADSANPIPFPKGTDLDSNVYDLLELDDHILEFDLEPNRPDLFSIIGMARDLSAIFDTPLRTPNMENSDWSTIPEDELRVSVQASDKVKRYAGLQIDNIVVSQSPMWLQNSVRKLGMRPINNVVDAANLAMLELGQPMHTFDASTMKTKEIGLRMARDGEKITTLDGEERDLTSECLLVTDGDTPVALAGVMGDQHSEINGETTSLFIESATFDMATVRRCSRRLSLRTESSLRFEKGLPTSNVIPAMARLAHLLKEVGGPNVSIGGHIDHYPAPSSKKQLLFSVAEATERMALDVPEELIRARFNRLGIEVGESWNVTLPDFRPDLNIQADLNEEVGRIHGYEHVVAEPPSAPLSPPRENPVYTKGFAFREALTGAGFDEVYLGIWFGEAEIEGYNLERSQMLDLKNPLTSDLTHFRTTALPDLLSAVGLNRKSNEAVRLFEIAKIYLRTADGEIDERHHLSGAVSVAGKDPGGVKFFEARDAVVGALTAVGVEQISISRPDSLPDQFHKHTFHPGRWAAINHNEKIIAVVGELHPKYLKQADLTEPPVTFHVDLQGILSHRPTLKSFTPPPRFPSMEYHLNVLAPSELYSADLLKIVADARLSQLVRHTVRAVYKGQGVPEGKKRVTLELEFNNPDRSLAQQETVDEVERLKAPLEEAGLVLEF
jgi:phenylalanyl-tRNA synthetase beta chain